ETIQARLTRSVDGAHAALADEFDDLKLREDRGQFLDWRWDKSPFPSSLSAGLSACFKSGANQAFGAKAERHIRRQRLFATRAYLDRIHAYHFYCVLRKRWKKVAGNPIEKRTGATERTGPLGLSRCLPPHPNPLPQGE